METEVRPTMAAYAECMNAYAKSHLRADAGPYQIADAAAGSCSAEYGEMERATREYLLSQVDPDYHLKALALVRLKNTEFRDSMRRMVVETVVNDRTPAAQ